MFIRSRHHAIRSFLSAAIILLSMNVQATPEEIAESPLQVAARQFLERELAHLGEEIQVSVSAPALDVSDCTQPAPYLQQNEVSSSGRIFVGIACESEQQQRFFLQAQVKVLGHYLRANQTIAAGTPLQADMLDSEYGDITALLNQGVLSLDDLAGKTARHTLSRNRIVTRNQLRMANLVDRGEVIQFSVSGGGFSVSGQAEALDAGNAGDRIRIRTAQRKMLSGIIRTDGGVSVSL